jgi:hypothetical protein
MACIPPVRRGFRLRTGSRNRIFISEASMSSPWLLFIVFVLGIAMLVWPIWVRTPW